MGTEIHRDGGKVTMQETLFEITHVHAFEVWKGPIKTKQVIESNYLGSKWCWTCASWINSTPEETANFFARQIKKGNITRKDAIDRYRYWTKSGFGMSVIAIDIAIGDLNAGGK